RLDRNLVLRGVEVGPFPLADPAAREAPLGAAPVGALLRDDAREALALAAARQVVHEHAAQLVELRHRAAEAALEHDVGILGAADQLPGGAVEATLLDLDHRRFGLEARAAA